jgi:P-type Cu2+ transporter
MAKDPICGMEFDEKQAKFILARDGKKIYFCSKNCYDKFLGTSTPHKMANKDKHPDDLEHNDHTQHHKHMIADFKKRFIWSVVATAPILVLSPLVQKLLGFSFAFAGDKYISFTLSSFIFFYGGWPFLKGIYSELKEKKPGMMTLIALAITVAYVYSSAVVFGLEGEVFFWELATLIDIMLLGHWIEMRSVLGASKALEKLAQLMPDTAHLIKGGQTLDLKISELNKGDIVLVKAGEKIPSDGIIIKGRSYLDESMLTGESRPVAKKATDKVIGGSVNSDGILEIKVTGTGKDSYLSKVITLVRDAQASKSKTQLLADKAAFWLTLIAITAGAGTFTYWISVGDLVFALERMATVMVITCPHALGLAIPLVVAVSTSLSAKSGLLIRNRTAFENARKISAAVFDKTGTLTQGKFGLSSIASFDDSVSKEQLLQLAFSLEQNSEHPVGKAVILEGKKAGLSPLNVSSFEVLKGEGIEGKINGRGIKIVSPAHLKRNNILSPGIDEKGTTVYVLEGGRAIGAITLSDKIREQSYQAIKTLQTEGIKCYMLTGDNEKTARAVAGELKLDGYFAEVLPHHKQDKVRDLQVKNEFVAMVGDGINDAPALAQADVGIAIGSGTDIAAETSDIVLVNSNPKDVASVILFGKATYRKMLQNLAWATGYNVFAIPLAAGVFYSYGIIISPAIGAALMSISTVVVALNAKMLSIK